MANKIKKMSALLMALFMVLNLNVAAFATDAALPGIGVKTDTLIDRETNRYEVTIEVPGVDGDNRHDEVILMVDGSYSLDEEWPAMKEAINTIAETVLNGSGTTQLTLMAFGMGDNEVIVHAKDAKDVEATLGSLPGSLLYGRSSTNCEAGFTGVAEYIENHDETLKDVHVIFISDGNLNTDETPRAFDANWQTWTKFGALTVAQVAFEETVLYGENLPAAFTTVFGDRFDGATKEETLDRAFGGEVTDEEFLAFAEQLWTDVYAYSRFTRGAEYPVSDAERAFVKYDKENGTYIQDLFYYSTYKSAYVTYGDRWTRTPAAADALAAMDEVAAMYVVDYDGYTSWMDTGITSEKSTFVQSNGIAGLCEALSGALTDLAKTPFNDVVVTDYMSKWVNLDASTLKIVDNSTGATIWSAAEGWLTENRPTAQEVPVVVELVDPAAYAAGGADVIGNTSGDIYKLTWCVKDGAMLRSDNYTLVYEVTVDTVEEGFQYEVSYPANGNTTLFYKDENGNDKSNVIVVPVVDAPVVEPETTTVSGSKTWDDSDNQDGKRPESIIVNLFANGVQVDSKVVTEADGWAWTFADLDKYADGVEILYTISEEPVEGYIPTINGYDITNSYEPEQTYVSGRKIWNDDNNRDGVRPDSIVIRLWADGVQIDSKVVTAADAWAWYFFDLDKYQNGREIDYTITEDPVPGYTTTIAYGVVTNTYIPETTSIPVSKVWNDNNNQDGVRPNSITVTLLADGVDTGLSVVLSAVNGWKSAFTDLPRYENNAEINYSVVESSVEGYVSTITGNAANGFEIINSRETAKITVSGTKTWIDNDNETGIRPESITINLHANGAVIASKTVSEADGWAWTFADLDMYADGKEIAYTITENVVDGYMTEVHGYDVINYLTETPEDFEEFEEIEDEDVPLASPQTADVASLWAVSALVSGGAVKFIRRKKRYEDD